MLLPAEDFLQCHITLNFIPFLVYRIKTEDIEAIDKTVLEMESKLLKDDFIFSTPD